MGWLMILLNLRPWNIYFGRLIGAFDLFSGSMVFFFLVTQPKRLEPKGEPAHSREGSLQ